MRSHTLPLSCTCWCHFCQDSVDWQVFFTSSNSFSLCISLNNLLLLLGEKSQNKKSQMDPKADTHASANPSSLYLYGLDITKNTQNRKTNSGQSLTELLFHPRRNQWGSHQAQPAELFKAGLTTGAGRCALRTGRLHPLEGGFGSACPHTGPAGWTPTVRPPHTHTHTAEWAPTPPLPAPHPGWETGCRMEGLRLPLTHLPAIGSSAWP